MWKHDPKKAKKAGSVVDITRKSVLYPKLFRRLVDYYKAYTGGPGSLVLVVSFAPTMSVLKSQRHAHPLGAGESTEEGASPVGVPPQRQTFAGT